MPVRQPHEAKASKTIKAMIYAPPGAGKTTLACSAPNPVLIDGDGGYHRLEASHQVPVIQMESWQGLQDDITKGELAPYDTIIFDTTSKILDYLTQDILAKNPKLRLGVGQLTLQGYGKRKGMFSNFIKSIENMGKHVIFVCHEKEDKNNDEIYIRPLVGGSSGKDLFMDLDLIGYMYAHEGQRRISFFPSKRFYAKNSCGLENDVVVPTLKEGQKNNFFEEYILGAYHKRLIEKEQMTHRYTELIDLLTAKCEAVKDAPTANEYMTFVVDYKEHMYDSLVVARGLIRIKAKELKLVIDKENKCFLEPDKPTKTESPEKTKTKTEANA